MKNKCRFWLAAVGMMAMLPSGALAAGGTLAAHLNGFEEVPPIASRGTGFFTGTLSADESRIDWRLVWDNRLNDVAEAHIHFAQPGVNGGVLIFLCSNLGNAPAGTPACPGPFGADFTGHSTAADVVTAPGQALNAGQLTRVVRAIRLGKAYVNVHSAKFPSGEIRGQIEFTPTP